jgi:anti-sigma-K factor RskA
MNRETFEELIPAYVLGALDAEELAEFEALLADDPEAQRLVAEYQAITDQLVLTTPARPAPAHLQDDLRRRLASQPAKVTLMPQQSVKWRSSALPVLVGLAAALAVVIGVAVFLLQPQTPREVFDRLSQRVALIPQAGYEDVHGVLATDGSQAVICMRDMPSLPDDRVFQLWFAYADGALQSSKTFEAANGEICEIVPLANASAGYQAFAVSIEPPGGSPDPTTPSGDVVFIVPASSTEPIG